MHLSAYLNSWHLHVKKREILTASKIQNFKNGRVSLISAHMEQPEVP